MQVNCLPPSSPTAFQRRTLHATLAGQQKRGMVGLTLPSENQLARFSGSVPGPQHSNFSVACRVGHW